MSGPWGQIKAGSKKRIVRSLQRVGFTINRIDLHTKRLVSPDIPGWFSVAEAQALYMLAATTRATRIMEVGHFLGRSTSAICQGIQESGSVVEFNSYDLGFTSPDEFVAHYRRVHDTCATEVPEEYDRLVFAQGKTTTEIAKAHLSRFGLDGFVNLINGDFRILNRAQYDFIFCDAMHDHGETTTNLPHVITASGDDCVWAFHDMNASNIANVLQNAPARLIRVVDSLGVFRFQRVPG